MTTEIIDDSFLSFAEISVLLQDRRLYLVAERTNLTYPTLLKLKEGKATEYNYQTIVKINKYLKPFANDLKFKK